jgi:hypothetical protein
VLVEALRAAIDTKGEYFVPDGKVPLQAADQEVVREIFYRRYIDGEDSEKKSTEAQRKAFKHAVQRAVERDIINGEKDGGGRQMLWFKRDEGVLEEFCPVLSGVLSGSGHFWLKVVLSGFVRGFVRSAY